jgi:hypothetical protein
MLDALAAIPLRVWVLGVANLVTCAWIWRQIGRDERERRGE